MERSSAANLRRKLRGTFRESFMCGGEIFKPIQVTRKMSDYSDESNYDDIYGTNHIWE